MSPTSTPAGGRHNPVDSIVPVAWRPPTNVERLAVQAFPVMTNSRPLLLRRAMLEFINSERASSAAGDLVWTTFNATADVYLPSLIPPGHLDGLAFTILGVGLSGIAGNV